MWLCSMSKTAGAECPCPLAYHSVSVRTLHRRNRHIRSVQIGFARTRVLSEPVLSELTILCRLVPADHVLSTDVLSGVVLSTNSTSCWRQQKILRQYSCSTRELILGFLRACFWAFIFGALGRWTELWSRLGQARCVGVMAALPQPSLA